MTRVYNQTKKIIDSQIKTGAYSEKGISYSKYSKFYLGTNENVQAALNCVDFTNKDSALTALASGDQAFNFILNGINHIDTFDLNGLTEYYVFGIKLAMIEKYNYQEYVENFKKLVSNSTPLYDITVMVIELLPYMELKYRNFWQDIINYNYNCQKDCEKPLNLFQMLSYYYPEFNQKPNNYLLNEENYNNFKSNLKNVHITFKRVNAANLDKKFHQQYDFIYLSNILDYIADHTCFGWDYNYLKNYFEKLHKLTKDKGVILATAFNSSRKSVWLNSSVYAEELLLNEQMELIPSAYTTTDIQDRVILSRKKNNILTK